MNVHPLQILSGNVQNRPPLRRLGSAAARYDPEHAHIIDAINYAEDLHLTSLPLWFPLHDPEGWTYDGWTYVPANDKEAGHWEGYFHGGRPWIHGHMEGNKYVRHVPIMAKNAVPKLPFQPPINHTPGIFETELCIMHSRHLCFPCSCLDPWYDRRCAYFKRRFRIVS